MNPGVVPMIAPNGSSGDIPFDRVKDATAAGFKTAVVMTSPDGQMGYVPQERAADAMKAGFKVGQPTTQFEKDRSHDNQPGIIHSALSEIGNIAKSAPAAIAAGFEGPAAAARAFTQNAAKIGEEDALRKDEGRSGLYRGTAAAVSAFAPVTNVRKMEEQANVGNTHGVLGTAIGDAAPVVAPLAMEGAAALANKIPLPVSKAAQALAERGYQSALKPPTTLEPWQRKSVIQTGLNSEIPVSESGLNKLNSLVDDLNQKISDVIATKPGNTINKFAVTKRLGDVADRFSNQVAPSSDLAKVADVGNDFLDTKPGQIPVAAAQEIKKGTYQTIGSRAYGEVKAAQIESEKALARGIKEELETQFPEIKGLNQQESKFLGLEPSLQRALGRNSNHQMLGIGTPIAAGAASAVTDSAKMGAIVGTIKAVVDNPIVKSKLAIALNKSSKGAITLTSARAKIAGYSASLGASIANNQDPGAKPNQP